MNKDRVVFDCNVYLQFLLNRDGAAGKCVQMALENRIDLFVSPQVIQEIHELPMKNIGIQRGLMPAAVQHFTEELLIHVSFIEIIPTRFTHPIDPDDSVYVNLALVAQAKLIVSNDNHLLNLTDSAKPWSQSFRDQYSDITILKPAEYLEYWQRRDA